MRRHDVADRHLPGTYTIEHRFFQDGDERITATHAIGYELGTRLEYTLWCTREPPEVWVEYYEGDILRDRRVYRTGLVDRVV